MAERLTCVPRVRKVSSNLTQDCKTVRHRLTVYVSDYLRCCFDADTDNSLHASAQGRSQGMGPAPPPPPPRSIFLDLCRLVTNIQKSLSAGALRPSAP